MPVPEELQVKSQRVLIVEDDEKMAKAIQRALERKGFETQIADDGFGAGSLASSYGPAVMTLDLQMPGLGGLVPLPDDGDLVSAGVQVPVKAVVRDV